MVTIILFGTFYKNCFRYDGIQIASLPLDFTRDKLLAMTIGSSLQEAVFFTAFGTFANLGKCFGDGEEHHLRRKTCIIVSSRGSKATVAI